MLHVGGIVRGRWKSGFPTRPPLIPAMDRGVYYCQVAAEGQALGCYASTDTTLAEGQGHLITVACVASVDTGGVASLPGQ